MPTDGKSESGSRTLAGRRIAVPETRELDRLAGMLGDRGAAVLRCPLVAIRDAADPAPVEAWLRGFVATPCDDLVLLTGEGLRRLDAAAGRIGLQAPFRAALAGCRKIGRGPKPGQALRALGLTPDLTAAEPTTAGVIATLGGLALQGRQVGVQLYPDNPNQALLDAIAAAGATPLPVLPYAYASEVEDRQVSDLIDALEGGRVDVIAFTSSPQVKRLYAVARAAGREAALTGALGRTVIAAVGPVVAETLTARGLTVAVMPEGRFFMKPLVTAIEAALGGTAAA